MILIVLTRPTVVRLMDDCVSTGSGEEVLNSVVLNNILKNALRFSSRVSNQEQESVTEVLSFSINPGKFHSIRLISEIKHVSIIHTKTNFKMACSLFPSLFNILSLLFLPYSLYLKFSLFLRSHRRIESLFA